jgi:hypothetical protein
MTPDGNVNLTCESDRKLALLRTAIHDGDSSGDSEEGMFERLCAYIDELALKRAENIPKFVPEA